MKTIYQKLLFLVLLLPFSVFAQGNLEGVVLDSKTKQSLPGVNVVAQGTTNGVSTDFDGKFKLSKLKKGDKVVFSSIGYKSETIEFNNQSSINVSLEEESNLLQEIVVQVGYGSVKKKDATGSVDLITSKDFNKGAITSVDGLLNGRASGVVVTSSGTPGNDAVIRIRGGSSLLASNDPLIVVDGLPIDGGLSSVNPNDIDTFSILKDASATAIYGNRGSNGVIIITTKKGSKKGLQVSLNTFTTFNTLAKKVDVFSADEYRWLIARVAPDKAGLLGTANTDWQDEIFNSSFTSDTHLSAAGNLFNKVPARVSLGNTDNNGLLMTSNFKRSTISTSLNPSFFDDHLKINLTANYSYTFRRNADEGAIGAAISYDPTQSVFDDSSIFAGYTEWTAGGNPRGTANPVSLLNEVRNIGNQKRFFGNFNVDYKFHFLPALRAIINVGMDRTYGTGSVTVNPLSRVGYNVNLPVPQRQIGSFSENWFENQNQNMNAQLNYTKTFGKFNVDAIAGYDYQQFDNQNYFSGNRNLFGLGQAEELREDVFTSPGNKLGAYLGRLNLGFADKYLLTINYRRDGSSRISPVNKWDDFMGFAFAWKIKEESFLKNSNFISDLKLRLSYGEVGQQNVPFAYDWLKRYNASNNISYQFGNTFVPIARPEGYNENLQWEKSQKYNAGLDFGFFNNKLKGSIDAYFARTNDLFSEVSEGALQNLRIIGVRNVGSLESKGLDFSLNYQAIKNENFDLNMNYNITYNHLEITDLFTDNILQGNVGLNGFVQTHKIGLAPFSYWVYQQVYDAAGKPIEGAYVDRNADGIVDSKDKYNYKKPNADITMGYMVNATLYKNWDFTMAWRASFGGYVYDRVTADRTFISSINNLVDGTLNNSPANFYDTEFQFAQKESDHYIKDGSFIKLDNVTIGYKINNSFGGKTNLRIYTGVQNALIFTKYRGIDPEVFNNGIDGTIFPRARMFLLGMNVNF
jgi:TonB-linked SusC/RagA family outer membrane protein